jgi:peptidoglycan/xylan/chitin deacetylase (PgdA/CDA1 family)
MLRHVVKIGAAGADRLRPPPRGVVVLIYHRVGGRTRSEIDLDASLFDDQMGELARSGRVRTLGAALDELARPAPVGDGHDDAPLVAVTFDDGTADFVDVVVPILERHRVPATLYLATAFVEDRIPFPGDVPAVTWSGLADACATGLVDVGSHTHRHRLLDRLPAAEVDDELDRSVGLIGERLGRAPADFAYPKSVLGSPAAEAAIRRRFRSAALAGSRANRVGSADPYRLGRSPIQASDGMRWFRRKVAGGMALEGRLRELLDRRRYATKTS